jgi:hypothetical protein
MYELPRTTWVRSAQNNKRTYIPCPRLGCLLLEVFHENGAENIDFILLNFSIVCYAMGLCGHFDKPCKEGHLIQKKRELYGYSTIPGLFRSRKSCSGGVVEM